MAETQADAAVMASTAARFDEVNTSLQDTLTRLMSELAVLSGSWRGLGAAAFEQVKTQYATDLRNLGNALAETAEAIRSSGAGYDAADTGAAARVARSGGTFTLPL